MNKKELVAEISNTLSLPKIAVGDVIDCQLKVIGDKLAAGEEVQIIGFGTFKVVDRDERRGRNPRTGEEIIIAAHKAPIFTPGKTLKDFVQNS